jgi:hypothetical protein
MCRIDAQIVLMDLDLTLYCGKLEPWTWVIEFISACEGSIVNIHDQR